MKHAAVALMIAWGVCLPSVLPARQEPPVPKPLVPAAANSILEAPHTFYGQVVTVTAAVEQIVSSTSFTVDQDPNGSSAAALLVIAPVLTEPVTANVYLTIIGEVVRHEGHPAIRATSVLTAAGLDLAKQPPPPLSADEEAFDRIMKTIGPAFTRMREAVSAAGDEAAADHASALMKGFGEAEVFWRKRDVADAQKWAGEARGQSDALQRAIAAGRWEDAKRAVSSLQQACAACHAAYRVRLDDGSYRIRPMGNERED